MKRLRHNKYKKLYKPLPDGLFEKCTEPCVEPIIHVSMIRPYLYNQFGFYWGIHVKKPEKNIPVQECNQHESRCLSYMEHSTIKTVQSQTCLDEFKRTLNAMVRGDDVIINPLLMYLPTGMIGTPDMIERRNDGKSKFWPYHYVVKDTQNYKRHIQTYKFPAVFNAMILGIIQDYTPDTFVITTRKDDKIFSYASYEQKLLKMLQEMRDIVAGTVRPLAAYDEKCSFPWSQYENEIAVQVGDLNLLPDIKDKRRAILHKAGIITVNDLISYTVDDIRRKTNNKISPKILTTVQASAFALINKKSERRNVSPYNFPTNITEIFLDLEGNPGASAGQIYMIGMVIREPNSKTLRYVSFNEYDCGSRTNMFREFVKVVDDIATDNDYVIYHWGAYDRTNIKELFEQTQESWNWSEIMTKFVDLNVLIKQQYAMPLYNVKLKTVAPYIGFEWRQVDVDAMSSYSLYNDYVAESNINRENLDKVMKYNEDDCVATVKILDWMIENQTVDQ